MYLHVPLLAFLLTLAPPADAGFAPHQSLARATERLHKFALRHSAGLARDLRIVLQGIAADEQPQASVPSSSRVFCARPDPLGTNNGTSPATPTTPTTSGGTATDSGVVPTATSVYQLQESHVRTLFLLLVPLLNLLL